MSKVKVKDIKIENERFREEFGDIDELAVSIQRYGLLHPIVVDRQLELIAGERRLKAHMKLGLDEIEVKYLDEVDALEKREIEIEENLRRKDFTWQEEVKARKEVDSIKREMYGHAVPGHGGGWSIEDTANALGVSKGTVSKELRLAVALDEFPELSKEKTKEAAWNRYQRLRERRLSERLADVTEVKVDEKCLVFGKSEIEMGKLASKSVDLVLTDPPFAIALDKGFKSADAWGGKIYDDELREVLDTIDLVMTECFRVLKENRHMYVFFGVQHYEYLYKLLVGKGFNVAEVPLLWHKTAGAGAGGSEYAYASNYEMCFFCMKGRRPLNKLGESNVFVEPRDAPQRKVHPTQKPTALLRRFVSQSSLPGELVVDPFAGSSSTLIAAFQVKRMAWGCEKDKEYYAKGLMRIKTLKEMMEKEG